MATVDAILPRGERAGLHAAAPRIGSPADQRPRSAPACHCGWVMPLIAHLGFAVHRSKMPTLSTQVWCSSSDFRESILRTPLMPTFVTLGLAERAIRESVSR